MSNKIFKSILFMALAVLLSSITLISVRLYSDFTDNRIDELNSEIKMIASGVEQYGTDFLECVGETENRITLIDQKGNVIFDNMDDISLMDNHLDRQEVKEALETGYGQSIRYSQTLLEQMIYTAIQLNDGTVLRLSHSSSSILFLMGKTLSPILFFIGLIVLTCLFVAKRLANQIVKPLNEIDVDHPDETGCYKEIQPIMHRLSDQQKQINEDRISLERQKLQFTTITENMNEGLVLLNPQGEIVNMDKSAMRILGVGEEGLGKQFALTHYYYLFESLLKEAFIGNRGSKNVKISNVEYQIETSPVQIESDQYGVVILIFDNSYKDANEKLRKEFASNVSHELKTPLQAISGYAELLKNDLVVENDKDVVYDKIYSEAQRMTSLINDIIKLSHLDDDEMHLSKEKVDLYNLADNVIYSLKEEAKKQNIDLSLIGESEYVYGNRQLLESIIYNLCENGIKYSHPNGKVQIEVSSDETHAILKVADTGIGIAEEDQERIFERFYRVDKSHSREIGGTGLGLSIVKHAVILNNGEITLDSKVGVGSTFTVRFLKAH